MGPLPEDDLSSRTLSLIKESELADIIKLDAELMRQDFANTMSGEGPTTQFCIMPSIGSHMMRLEGVKFIFGKVARTVPDIWGAQIGDRSDPSNWSFVLWMPSLADNSALRRL